MGGKYVKCGSAEECMQGFSEQTWRK